MCNIPTNRVVNDINSQLVNNVVVKFTLMSGLADVQIKIKFSHGPVFAFCMQSALSAHSVCSDALLPETAYYSRSSTQHLYLSHTDTETGINNKG